MSEIQIKIKLGMFLLPDSSSSNIFWMWLLPFCFHLSWNLGCHIHSMSTCIASCMPGAGTGQPLANPRGCVWLSYFNKDQGGFYQERDYSCLHNSSVRLIQSCSLWQILVRTAVQFTTWSLFSLEQREAGHGGVSLWSQDVEVGGWDSSWRWAWAT